MQNLIDSLIFENAPIQDHAPLPTPHSLSIDLKLTTEPNQCLHLINGLWGTGRESLLKMLKQQLLKSGVAPELILKTDLLDLRLQSAHKSILPLVIDAYLRRFPQARRTRFYLLIDNLENAPKWEELLGHLRNTYNVLIAATAACNSWRSRLLSGNIPPNTHLHTLYPRPLSAILSLETDGPTEIIPSEIAARREEAFKRYAAQGGIGTQNILAAQRLLRIALADDVLSRNPTFAFPLCINIAARALGLTGELLSVAGLTEEAKLAGTSTTRATVTKLLAALQEAHIISLLKEFRHAHTGNSRMSHMVYAGDLGLASACCREGELSALNALATIVFHELNRRGIHDIFYLRTLKRGTIYFAWGNPSAQQVSKLLHITTAPANTKAFEQSVNTLVSGMKEAGTNRATLISLDDTATLHRQGLIIDVVSLWKWLAEH